LLVNTLDTVEKKKLAGRFGTAQKKEGKEANKGKKGETQSRGFRHLDCRRDLRFRRPDEGNTPGVPMVFCTFPQIKELFR